MPHSTHGTIALMGSGEMASSMVEVHKYAMSLVEGPVRAVFVDTPAGFQLNADLLSQKAVEYFAERLHTPLEIVSFKNAASATRAELRAAVILLRAATYIFAGPGSPTYAIRNWRHTPVYDAMFETVTRGGCLTFASAAALTLGRWTIPVYEVYKVGEPAHWVEGLDTLGHSGFEVAIVPHWNNNSGGDHDTNYCFMGAPRWELLESQLPATTTVLGIDEHTACILRLNDSLAEVRGIGRVTVRRAGAEQIFPSGASFSLDLIRSDRAGMSPTKPGDSTPVKPVIPTWDVIRVQHEQLMAADPPRREDVTSYVYSLFALLSAARQQQDWPTMQRAEEALREAFIRTLAMLESTPVDVGAMIGPYVDLLLEVRSSLRKEKLWAQADRIRDRLEELGIVVQDTPRGVVWKGRA